MPGGASHEHDPPSAAAGRWAARHAADPEPADPARSPRGADERNVHAVGGATLTGQIAVGALTGQITVGALTGQITVGVLYLH